MYPEAGGSSSLRPPRLQRVLVLLRRLGADAQLHDHDRHLGVLRAALPRRAVRVDALRHGPGDIFFGDRRRRSSCCRWSTSVGAKESAGVNILPGRRRLPHAAAARRRSACSSSSRPEHADRQRPLRRRADVEGLLPRDPGRHDRLHRASRRSRTWPRRPRTRTKTIPAAINRVVIAVFAIYALLPMVALSALPVDPEGADGTYTTLLGLPEEQGGFAGDPVLGVVKHLDLGFLQQPAEIYVGLLAATILFIATNAGIIGVSRLVYSMGLHRQVPDRLRQLHPKYGTPWIGILIFGARRLHRDDPGQGRVPGQHVRLRGDAVVHDRAHRRSSGCGWPSPTCGGPWTGPGNIRAPRRRSLPLFAVFGGIGTRAGVRRRHRAARRRRARRHRLAGARAASSTRSTAAARGWT